MVPMGKGEREGINLDYHVHIAVDKIINKDLLYSPGNYTQYSIIIYMGKASEKE